MKVNDILTEIAKNMTAAGTAVPIIFGAINGIIAIWNRAHAAVTMTPSEVADLIQQQLDHNDASGRAEIARLKAVLAGSTP